MTSINPDILGKYFEDYLRKGFNRIFEEQRLIAANQIYSSQAYRTDGTLRSRSGRLQAALASPSLSMTGSGASLRAVVNYPLYIRFLDMKRLGNYRIYNRPIWGILYKETFRNLKYEFSDWLWQFTHDTLNNTFNQ